MSTTDPDAAIVRRGKPHLRYQAHRAVDPKAEVVTATEVTAGDVNEAHRLIPLLDSHHANTGMSAQTAVADSKYGTIDNLLACKDRDVRPHMPTGKDKTTKRSLRAGIFPETVFIYDEQADTYQCPAGKTLTQKSLHKNRDSMDYGASRRDCTACESRPRCTRNRSGRTIKRHLRQSELEVMLEITRASRSKKDIRTRQHLMERSFARAERYGLKRARWRGRWRMLIQEYLTATIQNIETLMRYGKLPAPVALACEAPRINPPVQRVASALCFYARLGGHSSWVCAGW